MDLYMTELAFVDFEAALAWFREALGLPLILLDERRRFALLGSDAGRLALKAAAPGAAPGPGSARLVFRVDDLGAARSRLIGAGVAAGEVVEDPVERYRAFRVAGPEGLSIRIFAWFDYTYENFNIISR